MGLFTPRHRSDIADMVAQEVLGLVTTCDEDGFVSTPLPLLAELDEDGEVRALIGHFARSNPHVARAGRTPHALVSFFGPHGYVAPSLVSKPDWAPTWNYRLAQFDVIIDFAPDQASGDEAIRRLVAAMEGNDADSWTVARIGARYDDLVSRVIAFRAEVLKVSATFKLGQDEESKTFGEIVAGLKNSELAAQMRNQQGDR